MPEWLLLTPHRATGGHVNAGTAWDKTYTVCKQLAQMGKDVHLCRAAATASAGLCWVDVSCFWTYSPGTVTVWLRTAREQTPHPVHHLTICRSVGHRAGATVGEQVHCGRVESGMVQACRETGRVKTAPALATSGSCCHPSLGRRLEGPSW